MTSDLIIEKGQRLKQRNDLYFGTELIIGTPKRLCEMYYQNGFNIGELRFFMILDVNEIFKKGLRGFVSRISESLPKCKKIVFETYTSSQKIVNLKRDSRITVLLEDGLEYSNLRGVMIRGTSLLTEESAEVERIAREVIKRNQPEVPEEMLDDAAASLALKRTVVTIVPEKTVSWDHGKIF